MPPDTNNFRSDTACESPAVLVMPAALRQLAESGDTDLIEELIAIFQTDTAERLAILQGAVAAGEVVVVGAEAHTIKGSAVQVGANRLAEACRQMELEARTQPHMDFRPLLTRVLASFDEVCSAIAARNGLGQSAIPPGD